jgi:hypothetical protein
MWWGKPTNSLGNRFRGESDTIGGGGDVGGGGRGVGGRDVGEGAAADAAGFDGAAPASLAAPAPCSGSPDGAKFTLINNK